MLQMRLPEQVVLKNGEIYVLVFMKICSRRDDGSPDELRLVQDGDILESSTGVEEFMPSYVKKQMVQR